MGRTITYKYAIEMEGSTVASWKVKEYGAPTHENLKRYIEAFEKSMEPGGPNDHIKPYKVGKAIIRENKANGRIVADYMTDEYVTRMNSRLNKLLDYMSKNGIFEWPPDGSSADDVRRMETAILGGEA